jgi:3-phosphoshikimate 1-carboxyvinyltransferase
VPGDPSSAAFPAAAALLVPGSEVILRGLGMNPTRAAFFDTLQAMGAELDIQPIEGPGLEPVADIRVRGADRLRGIDLPPEWIPAMIDEIPVLLALAACAEGVTRIREAGELRVKESDRLAVMARGLARMGIAVREYDDGIDVTGGRPVGARVDAAHDHRCAMSFAVLAQACDGATRIDGAGYIDTSYPSFLEQFRSLGARLDPVAAAS